MTARAEDSHFNLDTTFAEIAYGLMGLGAVTIRAVAGFIGCRPWRHRNDGLMTEAAAFGLVAGAPLGTLAGASISAK